MIRLRYPHLLICSLSLVAACCWVLFAPASTADAITTANSNRAGCCACGGFEIAGEIPPDSDGAEADDRDRDDSSDRPRRRGLRRGGGDREQGRRAGRGQRGRGRGPRIELTPEIIERIMAFVREKLPETFYEQLQQLRKNDPDRFKWALRRIAPKWMEYERLKEHDPEMAELVVEEFVIEHQLRKLAKAYGEAEGNEERQAELEVELERLVRRQIQIEFRRREAKIHHIENRLAKERERLASEKTQVEDIVARRLKQAKKARFHRERAGKFRERDGDHKKRARRGRHAKEMNNDAEDPESDRNRP